MFHSHCRLGLVSFFRNHCSRCRGVHLIRGLVLELGLWLPSSLHLSQQFMFMLGLFLFGLTVGRSPRYQTVTCCHSCACRQSLDLGSCAGRVSGNINHEHNVLYVDITPITLHTYWPPTSGSARACTLGLFPAVILGRVPGEFRAMLGPGLLKRDVKSMLGLGSGVYGYGLDSCCHYDTIK